MAPEPELIPGPEVIPESAAAPEVADAPAPRGRRGVRRWVPAALAALVLLGSGTVVGLGRLNERESEAERQPQNSAAATTWRPWERELRGGAAGSAAKGARPRPVRTGTARCTARRAASGPPGSTPPTAGWCGRARPPRAAPARTPAAPVPAGGLVR